MPLLFQVRDGDLAMVGEMRLDADCRNEVNEGLCLPQRREGPQESNPIPKVLWRCWTGKPGEGVQGHPRFVRRLILIRLGSLNLCVLHRSLAREIRQIHHTPLEKR